MNNDPLADLRAVTRMLRQAAHERTRRVAKMSAEAFQRRECGLALPRADDGATGDE